jgi:serine/threonine protein kinase
MRPKRTKKVAIGVAVNDDGVGTGILGANYVNIGTANFVSPRPGQDAPALGFTSRSALPITTGECDREPMTSEQGVRDVLEQHARIEVKHRIKIGQLSDVYYGEYGRRKLAIKVFHNSLLPRDVQEKLETEIAITLRLNHPSFLRIFNVLFVDHLCFIVSDFVEDCKTIGHELNMKNTFSIEEVYGILNQLCEVLIEAEAVGLGYLSIIPSQIFVRRPAVVRLSPINFMLFKSQTLIADLAPRWNIETGPFMAPEFWHGPSYFMQGKENESDILERTRSRKANQFALGMLAWMMLEGKLPVLNARNHPADLQDQFEHESQFFSTKVAQAPWQTKAPALARIVQRMVQYDPAKRWKSTNDVRLLIKALAAHHASNEVDDLVKNAFNIIAREKDLFYESFYKRFLDKATHLRGKFPTPMNHYQMLHHAIGQLLNFRKQQSEPTTLTQFVDKHGTRGLSKRDFEEFGVALIESFDASLANVEGHQRMMAALEIVIWPGILFMIQQCTTVNGTCGSQPPG